VYYNICSRVFSLLIKEKNILHFTAIKGIKLQITDTDTYSTGWIYFICIQ